MGGLGAASGDRDRRRRKQQSRHPMESHTNRLFTIDSRRSIRSGFEA
jgi:hypothetical protein